MVTPQTSTSRIVTRGVVGAGSSSRRISSMAGITASGVGDHTGSKVRIAGEVQHDEADLRGDRVKAGQGEQETEPEHLLVRPGVLARQGEDAAEHVVAGCSARFFSTWPWR